MLFVKWPGVNWGPLSWARKVFDTTHYERNNFGEKVSQRSWTSWKKNPTSYLFFLISSQSEIRRKLTSFVIWPQLPIFQLKSLLREAALRPKNSFEKMVSASQQMLLSFWMGQKIDHELPCGDFNASFCYVITANVILIFHLSLDVIKE